MEFYSIASGSSGNCICVGDDDTHVMIDAGISGKRIEEGMNAYGYTTSDMAGLLITHEHSDHISGVGVISRKYGLPIYGTAGTLASIKRNNSLGKIDLGLFREIKTGVNFQIGSLDIYPMHISHDAADPVAYIVSSGNKRIGIITDLGYFDENIILHSMGLDAMLVEANHDVHMLEVGPYPYPLKQRILGEHGHLSNDTCAKFLNEILHDDTKHVLLGHLSKENNYPQLAYETVRVGITMGDCPYTGSDFPIEVAPRSEVSRLITV